MSDRWNQQFHMDFRRLWIGPMHTMSRFLQICMQIPNVPVKTTTVPVSFHGLKKLLPTEVVVTETGICQRNEGMWQREHLIMKNLISHRRGSTALKTQRFIWAHCPRIRSSRRRNWIWGQITTTAGITYNFLDSIQTGQQKRIILDLIMINGPLLVSDFLKQRLLLSSLQDSKKEKI